jgi:hypothetical protein
MKWILEFSLVKNQEIFDKNHQIFMFGSAK